jgi:hypothetical protein
MENLPVLGVAALAGYAQNGYIGGNLQFSYDRRIESGPRSGPALFYYLNGPGAGDLSGFLAEHRPTTARSIFDLRYDRSDC